MILKNKDNFSNNGANCNRHADNASFENDDNHNNTDHDAFDNDNDNYDTEDQLKEATGCLDSQAPFRLGLAISAELSIPSLIVSTGCRKGIRFDISIVLLFVSLRQGQVCSRLRKESTNYRVIYLFVNLFI